MPVARIYFRFPTCKNWNAKVTIPTAGMLTTGAFLSYISLAVFVFLLVKIIRQATAAGMLADILVI